MNKYRTPPFANLITRARRAVQKAILEGRLIRLKFCEECGSSNCAIEAAHYDYVDLERVKWLCISCHRRWDKLQPKAPELPPSYSKKVLIGCDNPMSKLNVEQVQAIINSPSFHGAKAELARRFGVSQSLVGHIKQGTAWKHLPRK